MLRTRTNKSEDHSKSKYWIAPYPNPDFNVNNICEIKQHLEVKVKLFRTGCLSQAYTEWSALISDAEVLQRVKGMLLLNAPH